CLGEDSIRCCGSVYSSLCFGVWYSLYAVDARFIFKLAVYVLTNDFQHNFLISTGSPFSNIHDLCAPSFVFEKSRIHPVQVTREKGRFIATSTATNLNDSVFCIFWILWNEHQPNFFFLLLLF